MVETIASDPTQAATTNTEAPLVIQQLRSAGVTSVIPLIPFNVFYPILQAETSQQYYPRLLLSDYEECIESALGLIPIPYEAALDGQEGLTTQTLGGGTTPSNYTGPKGYDPGVQACWTPWHKAYPQIPAGRDDRLHRGAGTGGRLVRGDHPLRPAAHARAGPDLNRRSFVDRPVAGDRLPGAVDPDPQLRPGQALRADPLQDRAAAQQRPPVARSASSPRRGRPRAPAGSTSRSFQPLPTPISVERLSPSSASATERSHPRPPWRCRR